MADHWRTPHTPSRRIWRAIIAGAITGPLVAIGFAMVVIWIVGLVG